MKNFLKLNPDAENFNTYDRKTLKPIDIDHGLCVTFHQNGEGYTEENYAQMTAVTCGQLGVKDYNIGYYGNPEISFWVDSKKGDADYDEQFGRVMRFATEHNQDSVYEASDYESGCWYNPFYNEGTNDIEGSGYFGDRWEEW